MDPDIDHRVGGHAQDAKNHYPKDGLEQVGPGLRAISEHPEDSSEEGDSPEVRKDYPDHPETASCQSRPPQGVETAAQVPVRVRSSYTCGLVLNKRPSAPNPIALLTVSVNNELIPLESGISIAALLRKLGLENHKVAVERNGEIVPRSQHQGVAVEDGDRIEVVVAVGGG